MHQSPTDLARRLKAKVLEVAMSVQLSPIDAHERTIGQVFSDTYAFEVPPYQRPYAWEEEQTRELLEDLLDAMDSKEASARAYFLGSIVLIKSPNDPQSRVVDGQQRLTTLTILLSILRDLTTDQKVTLRRGSYVFEEADPDSGTQDRCRLLLRRQDRSFFQKYVQNSGATDNLPEMGTLLGSQQCIAENARYLRRILESVDEARRNDLVAFVLQRCYIVVVAVPTADTARRIFTVLNARGLDLTPTDILKADLLERAGPSRESDLAERWEAVEVNIGREKMVELFGHIRMIYERNKPRMALETGFPKFVTPFQGDADEFVSDILEPIADAAALLTENADVRKQFGHEVAKAVRSLERLDNKDWMPPALLRLQKRRPDDGQAVGEFLIYLERLAYFMFVCRHGINERMSRFAAVMDELDLPSGKDQPRDGLGLSDAEQVQFVEALEGPLYVKSRVCRPVLQRLDEALSAGGASYDDMVISIEHVLPQTVAEGSEWASLFPDPSQRGHWTHRIANLVLLTKRINTRASNWHFERKKKEYFASKDGTSPFPLTQGVLQTVRWSVEDLIKRQEQLLRKLKAVWALAPDESRPTDLDDPVETEVARCTGRELNEKWNIGAQHALYRKNGTWYHRLDRFPGALCDAHGYVRFETASDLEACPGVLIGREKNWLSVPGGIAILPGYVQAETQSSEKTD